MKIYDWLQFVIFIVALVALAYPLGIYFAKIFENKSTWMKKILGPLERWIYRVSHIDPMTEMDWKKYAISALLFNFIGLIFLYILLRIQNILPNTMGILLPYLPIWHSISLLVLLPIQTGKVTPERSH
jgi:K+-transporting ATPase ATPase A chain